MKNREIYQLIVQVTNVLTHVHNQIDRHQAHVTTKDFLII